VPPLGVGGAEEAAASSLSSDGLSSAADAEAVGTAGGSKQLGAQAATQSATQSVTEPGPTPGFTIAMFADMGRGTRDDSKTWHEYGSPAVNVSAYLAADAAAGSIGAAFLFGDLSYATVGRCTLESS
jgi:hypothetical protein